MPPDPRLHLEADVGTWRVDIRVPTPAGENHSAGDATVRLLGGRWLSTSYRSDAGDFEGEGLAGYDPDRGWVATWVDSMRPFLSVMTGTWDDATATMTYVGEGTVGGAPLRWRETTTRVDPDTRVFVTFVTGPDGVEREAMRATWMRTRPSDPA